MTANNLTVHGEIVRVVKKPNPLKEPVATPPAERVVEALERARDEIGAARGYTGDPDCHHHLNLALEAIAAIAAKDGRS